MKHRWYIILASCSTLALAFVLSLGAIDDFDVWYHIKCGEKFVREGLIFHNILFSYVAGSSRWVNGYLLPQILLYAAWWALGSGGVVLYGAILATGTFALSIMVSRRGAGFWVAYAVLLPAVLLARGYLVPRPALVSPAFMLATLWLLEDHRLRGGQRILWLIPLTAIWTNSHPMFFLGPIYTGIYIAGPLILALFNRAERPGEKWLKYVIILTLILVGQLLATLANPYGPDMYFLILSRAGHGEFSAGNLEMKPLFTGGGLLAGTIPCFILITGLGVAGFLWSGRRSRPEHIIVFIFTLILALIYRRNALNYAFLSLPLLSWAVTSGAEAKGFTPGKVLYRVRIWALRAGSIVITMSSIFLIWFAATDRLYFYTNTLRTTGLGIQKALFPGEATKLLKKEDIKGQLFHTFDLGGYLIFHLYPKYKVYIDGRIGYPLEVGELGQKALRSEEVFNTIKKKYDIRAVLLPLYDYGTWPMITALIHSRDWAVVQADMGEILFLERGAGNDSIIARYQLDLLANPPPLPSPPDGRKFGFFDRAEVPYGSIWWTMIYQRMGRADLAARALEPALNYRPVKKGIENWLKDLQMKMGEIPSKP